MIHILSTNTHQPANSLTAPSTNVQRAQALHRHLSENESECIKRNIIVRVDVINAQQNVAFCTVEQRLMGFFRRSYSFPELVWRAEQALAPLKELGITPLLTVRERTTSASAARTQNRWTPMDWVPDLWRWLGYPLAREGFGAVPVVHDPFGWKQAMVTSDHK